MKQNNDGWKRRIEDLLWAVYSAHEEPHSSSACIRIALEVVGEEIEKSNKQAQQEVVECYGDQHNFIHSQTTKESINTSGTGYKEVYYVICTKCGLLKKQSLQPSTGKGSR